MPRVARAEGMSGVGVERAHEGSLGERVFRYAASNVRCNMTGCSLAVRTSLPIAHRR